MAFTCSLGCGSPTEEQPSSEKAHTWSDETHRRSELMLALDEKLTAAIRERHAAGSTAENADKIIDNLLAEQCAMWGVRSPGASTFGDKRFAETSSVFCTRADLANGERLKFVDGKWNTLK